MNEYLETAIDLINDEVYDSFETIWANVVGDELPSYRVLVWGSVVDDRDRVPSDLDIIIEYTGDSIEPSQEKSIESWLKSEITTYEFSGLDPVVVHYLETEGMVSNSRVSEVYSVDENGWLEP
jgi:predicted nucleotidyltransferase